MSKGDGAFAAVLLAGGHSRRMGADKAFLPWQGRPLWRRQAELLLSLQPAQTFISARREQRLGFGATEQALWTFLYDPRPEYSPMEAIADAMRACGTATLVMAVDLPQMREEILQALITHWRSTGRGLVYELEGQAQPLTALYPSAMRPLLEDFVSRRVLRLRALVAEAVAQGFIDVRPLPSEWVPAFLNTNTPLEWNQARPPHP